MRMSELSTLHSGTSQPPRPSRATEPSDAKLQWAVRPFQPDEDLDRLCDLAEQAQQFSPLVGLELNNDQSWYGRSNLQPQALLLDVSGIGHLFGGEEALLFQVSQWLKAHRYFAYMSIASTVGAAWAMCNYEIPKREKQARSQNTQADKHEADVQNILDCRWLITDRWEEAELLASLPVCPFAASAPRSSHSPPVCRGRQWRCPFRPSS